MHCLPHHHLLCIGFRRSLRVPGRLASLACKDSSVPQLQLLVLRFAPQTRHRPAAEGVQHDLQVDDVPEVLRDADLLLPGWEMQAVIPVYILVVFILVAGQRRELGPVFLIHGAGQRRELRQLAQHMMGLRTNNNDTAKLYSQISQVKKKIGQEQS